MDGVVVLKGLVVVSAVMRGNRRWLVGGFVWRG
jgi:hypothetical protein